ncbi:putative fatty acyl-CoA reductase CG5065 isoform X2 [Galleria mellonella]|nr:putative fatty acyl-CoA reductase CG5065 isoform X2 [Galleria mellonella]
MDKLCIIPGNMLQPKLGISNKYLVDLQEVSIVFHSAATVKFNEDLRRAIEMNVLSVMRLLAICDNLPNIQAFVYVSTAYSNAELPEIEEKVYSLSTPIEQLLALVKDNTIDSKDLMKYITPKPNTYTFTKAMAEYAVQQHRTRRYPVAIFRPTIVISSHRNPFPGWIENLNGPVGVVAAVSTGLLHVVRCDGSKQADLLPVDIAVDTLIAVAWETVICKWTTIKVYNCSMSENLTTWAELQQAINYYTREYPHTNLFWYPFLYLVRNRFAYKILELLLQTIPLYILEYAMRVLGVKKEQNLILADRKFHHMNTALKFFVLREWRFKNENVRNLRKRLHTSDTKLFNIEPRAVNWDDHYRHFVCGVRKYLLKQNDDDLPQAKLRLRRAYILHNFVNIIFLVLFLHVLLEKKQRENIKNNIIILLTVCKALIDRFAKLSHTIFRRL